MKTKSISEKAFFEKMEKARKSLKREEKKDPETSFLGDLIMAIWSFIMIVFRTSQGPAEVLELPSEEKKEEKKGEQKEKQRQQPVKVEKRELGDPMEQVGKLERQVKELEKELKERAKIGEDREEKWTKRVDSQQEQLGQLKEENRVLKMEKFVRQTDRDEKLKAELERRWKNKVTALEKMMIQRHTKEIESLERKIKQQNKQLDEIKEEMSKNESVKEKSPQKSEADDSQKLERLRRSMAVLMRENAELKSNNETLQTEIDEKNVVIREMHSAFFAQEDEECIVCLNSMKQYEEELISCEHCAKQYHLECLSNWLTHSHTCPNCRGHTVDQIEFPSLS